MARINQLQAEVEEMIKNAVTRAAKESERELAEYRASMKYWGREETARGWPNNVYLQRLNY